MELFDVSSELSQVEMCLQDMFPSLAALSSSLKSDVIMSDPSPLATAIDSRENILPSPQSYRGVLTHIDATRPPYSFLDLTIMAIQSYPYNEATVQEIYDFISTSFPFFRDNILHWRNSVRHNLTVRPCFERKVYEFNSDKRIVWRYIESFHEDNCNSLSEDGILTPPPTPTHPNKDITLIPVNVIPLITAPIQIPPSVTTPPASPVSISPNNPETLQSSYNTPSSDANALPRFADLWDMVSFRPSFEVLRSLHQQKKLPTTQSDGNILEKRRENSSNTFSFPTNSNTSTSTLEKDSELVSLDNGLKEMELDEQTISNAFGDDLKFPADSTTTKKDNLPSWALDFPLMTRR